MRQPHAAFASYSFVLHFPTLICLLSHCHLPVYSLLFLMILLSLFLLHFSFITPFLLSAIFSLFVCICLSVCVDGIGLGSSPTSSQNEALPPSTDWPVTAYTSSFSLSSPETDDAGTWFIHKAHLPHIAATESLQTNIFPTLLLLLELEPQPFTGETHASCPFSSKLLINYDPRLSSFSPSPSSLTHAVRIPLWC